MVREEDAARLVTTDEVAGEAMVVACSVVLAVTVVVAGVVAVAGVLVVAGVVVDDTEEAGTNVEAFGAVEAMAEEVDGTVVELAGGML